MTEVGEETNVLDEGRKQSKRDRFRDLIKKVDKEKNKPEKPRTKEDNDREADLNDFLKSPSNGDSLPAFPSPSRKPVPRISVSTSPRWSGTPDESVENGPGDTSDPEDAVPKTKKQRKRGLDLNVKFADGPPQIIGVGGDSCEAPTAWISQSKAVAARATTLANHGGLPGPPGQSQPSAGASTSSVGPPDASDGTGAEDDFEPRPFQRVATGFPESSTPERDERLTAKRLQDAEFELTLESPSPGEKSQALNPDLLSAESDGRRRRMRLEEGRALSSGLRESSPDPSSQHQVDDTQHPMPGSYVQSPPISQHEHSPNASSDHLLPPGTSPAPSRPSSSSSYEHPPGLSSARQPRGLAIVSDENRPPQSVSPRRKPVPAALPSDSKEDILGEFRDRVRRYYTLFSLAAERVEPGLDAPLSKWVRAATWWFLAAETSFKLLRKDLDDGNTLSQVMASRRSLQAVVDLGKALWIVEDIVHQFAKKEAIDLSTPDAVDQAVKRDFTSRFCRTLQYWQDLSKRIGSLAAAARRSGFLTTESEDVPLSAGTDTSIWLKYPIQDPQVSNWLRAANPAWVLMDDTISPSEPFDIAKVIPLRNTANTFRIRSMFAHVSGGFREEDLAITLPCILTIGRRTGSHALVLFIVSQSHDVNVVIETDPVRGDGMEWHQAGSMALFNFADGFQFRIQLQKHEFNIFREIYDLALRALTGTTRDALLTPNIDDRIIFRATAKTFERRGRDRKPGFPYQGEQRDSDIVLFEKYEISRNGPTTHRAHRGLRLAVILSPQAMNLGILDVHLGGTNPILVHDAQKSTPPHFEMLDLQGATLIIQFARGKDFPKFLDLLTNIDNAALSADDVVQSVPMRSFSMESASSEAKRLFKDANWKQVQITTMKPRGNKAGHPGQMVPSPGISVKVASSEVVLAENLSQCRSNLQISLSPSPASSTTLTLLLPFQNSTSVRFDFRASPQSYPPTIFESILSPNRNQNLPQEPKSLVSRTSYTFPTPSDLHFFQQTLIGFSVLFDGTASSVSISVLNQPNQNPYSAMYATTPSYPPPPTSSTSTSSSGNRFSNSSLSTISATASNLLSKKPHHQRQRSSSNPNKMAEHDLGHARVQVLHDGWRGIWAVLAFPANEPGAAFALRVPAQGQGLNDHSGAESGGYFERVGSSGGGAGVKGRIAMGISRGKLGHPGAGGSGVRFVDVLSTPLPPSSSSTSGTENGGDTLSPPADTAGFLCLEHLAHDSHQSTNPDQFSAPSSTSTPPHPTLVPTTATITFDSEDDYERFSARLPAEMGRRAAPVQEKEKEKGLMGALHLR